MDGNTLSEQERASDKVPGDGKRKPGLHKTLSPFWIWQKGNTVWYIFRRSFGHLRDNDRNRSPVTCMSMVTNSCDDTRVPIEESGRWCFPGKTLGRRFQRFQVLVFPGRRCIEDFSVNIEDFFGVYVDIDPAGDLLCSTSDLRTER